jgi:methylated-DNA-[protein]-cysteine S-methyltransferase
MFSMLTDSPLGLIQISGNEYAITKVYFTGSRKDKKPPKESDTNIPDILKECAFQLLEYFDGKRVDFQIPTILKGTQLQKTVWQEICNIEYGKTVTFSELAAKIDKLNAVMVIGQMVHNNPLQLLVPDHRIVSEERTLTGHEDDIYRKDWLIRHEQRNNGDSLF